MCERWTDDYLISIEIKPYSFEGLAATHQLLTDGKIMVQRLRDLKEGKRSTKERIKKLSYTPTLQDAVPGDLSFVLPERILLAV